MKRKSMLTLLKVLIIIVVLLIIQLFNLTNPFITPVLAMSWMFIIGVAVGIIALAETMKRKSILTLLKVLIIILVLLIIQLFNLINPFIIPVLAMSWMFIIGVAVGIIALAAWHKVDPIWFI